MTDAELPRLEGFTTKYACDLALEAGIIMKELFKPYGVDRKIKDDKTPVTEADERINAMLIRTLRKDFPEISIQAEEGSDLTDCEWGVSADPVDGTFPWSWGMPISTFMAALHFRGVPVIGVIFDPFGNRMFYAEAGKGAFMNEERIHVSKVADASGKPVIGIESWPGCDFKTSRIRVALEERGFACVNFFSIGYQVAAVATGEFAGTIFPGRNPHDSAAGDLIIREAGGKATSILGKEQTYSGPVEGHLFSNGFLHDQLLEVILEVQAAQ